jgi:primary-amine oxidase
MIVMAVLDEAAARGAAASHSHPLDPLTPAEIEAAAQAVTTAAGLGPAARFVYISLYEPAKADVITFEAGGPAPERQVKVVIRDRAERASYEGIVSLDHAAVRSWRRVDGIQPPVMFQEFLAAEEVVRADPRWQEAMRRRGVTDFSLCMIDPWSAPNVEPSCSPPATTRTSRRAAAACLPSSSRTARWSTPTWWSGTRSAPITWSGRRTGR